MKNTKRIRPRLVILLWVWAACIFTIVDLFKNVPEFDRVRPEAHWYQATRYAAHKMVGEPYHDGGFADELPAPPVASNPLRDALVAVNGEEAQPALREHATQGFDPRIRIAALRALARRFGPGARETFLSVVRKDDELTRVRAEAARLLGYTGPNAFADLDALIRSDLSRPVRIGAVLGLGELGTLRAAERALALTEGRLRRAAIQAIARTSNPDAIHVLAPAAMTADEEVRVAACKALAASKDGAAVRPLTDLLADTTTPESVRAAAAQGLGTMGRREALPIVAAACADASPEVSRQARIAKTRLEHVRG